MLPASRAGDIILHRTQRARLVRSAEGEIVCVSPASNRYPIARDLPATMSVCAVWLKLTLGQIEEFLPVERLS